MRVRAACLLLFALGCDRSAAKSGETRPPASASSEATSPGAKLVASVVASVRSRELRIAAPKWQMQPLAFGRGLFVRLVKDGVEAYAMPEGGLAFEAPLFAPRAVAELPGGSVAVVASKGSFRIDPGAKEPVRLPGIPFLPGTLVLPDRTDSSWLWSVHTAGRVLSRHALVVSGRGTTKDVVALEDYDGGAVTTMRDGALLYRAEDGVRRAVPGRRARRLRADLRPWRLLPGRRVDQAWAIGEDGRVELWQVGDGLRVVLRLTLGFPPFDAAASSEHLAAVTVEEGGGTPRRFRLVVFSEKGEKLLEEALPERPAADGEGWASQAGGDRHVALSEGDGLVAVGGPGALRVLRIAERSTVLSR